MTDHLLHRNVSALFPRRRVARTVGVGIEHELLTRDATDGSAVAIDRVRRAVAGASYERWVGFEPGGQVELSLPCSPTRHRARTTVGRHRPGAARRTAPRPA